MANTTAQLALAVEGTVTDAGGQVFNVKAYGAVAGDQSVDNIPKIQAAIDAASAAGGGTVYVPWGTYYVAPSGTTSYIVAKSNVRLVIDGAIKIKDDCGDFEQLISSATNGTTAISNFSIEGCGKIDLNPTGNTTGTVAASNGARQFAVKFFSATNVAFRGVRFDPYCGINGVVVNTLADEEVVFDDCFMRFTPRTAPAAYDNSGIYFQAKYHRIQNSTFLSASGSGALAAIETHGGPSNVSGCITHGFATGVNAVTWSGAITEGNANDINIGGNTFSDAALAISVWCVTGHTDRSVNIVGNLISINQADRLAGDYAGIRLVNDAVSGTLNGTIDGLSILGNQIRFQAEERTPPSTESLTGGIVIDQQGAVLNLTLENNKVYNAPTQAFRVNGGTAGIDTMLASRNFSVDAGNNSLAATGYRAHWNLLGVIKNGFLLDNVIVDTATGSTPNGSGGIVNVITSGGFVLEQRNIIRVAGSGVLTRGFSSAAATERVSAFTVAGNVSMDTMKFDHWQLTLGVSTSAFSLTPFGNYVSGQRIRVTIINSSGGAGPAITWTNFKMASWTNPANGSRRTVTFENYDGTSWYEVDRTPGDVTN